MGKLFECAQKRTVLLAEDTPANLVLLSALLSC
jgi:hypothetical protein